MEVIRVHGNGTIEFQCPGCGHAHAINGSWQWNGDKVKPTFAPSILLRTGHFAGPGDCWCTYNAKHPEKEAPFVCVVCHSFIKDGRIEFLSDCTHKLAGQTVALREFESGGQQ